MAKNAKLVAPKKSAKTRSKSVHAKRMPAHEEPKEEKKKKKGWFSGLFLSKKEQKERTKISTKPVKLSKNFADQVLDLELRLDSGNFDIKTVNSLM